MNVNSKHHTNMPYCASHRLCIINKQLKQLPIAIKAFVVWFEGELQLLLVKTVAAHFIIWKKTHQCSILTCRNDQGQGVRMLSNSLEWFSQILTISLFSMAILCRWKVWIDYQFEKSICSWVFPHLLVITHL